MSTAPDHHQQALAAAIDRVRTRLETPAAPLPEAPPLSGEPSALDILTNGSLVQLCGSEAETRLVAASVMQTAGFRAAVITAANI